MLETTNIFSLLHSSDYRFSFYKQLHFRDQLSKIQLSTLKRCRRIFLGILRKNLRRRQNVWGFHPSVKENVDQNQFQPWKLLSKLLNFLPKINPEPNSIAYKKTRKGLVSGLNIINLFNGGAPQGVLVYF